MNNKYSILVTGAKGLVGSKFTDDFTNKYNFEHIDRLDPNEPIDITDKEALNRKLAESDSEFLIHLAAFTDVNAAWEQRDDKTGSVYQVNVVGTENLVKACEKHNKHIIHISTAYVFDGENPDLYTENDEPKPIEWYGQTKFEAEQVVMNSQANWTILRIDTPFRSDSFPKPDQARKIYQSILDHRPLFIDHFFGPTYIDDLAKVFDWVIRTKAKGLYHASSGEKWSDYEFAQAIAQTRNLTQEIQSSSLEDYLKTSQRPYQKNTALDCSKLKGEIDFELTDVRKALRNLTFDVANLKN